MEEPSTPGRSTPGSKPTTPVPQPPPPVPNISSIPPTSPAPMSSASPTPPSSMAQISTSHGPRYGYPVNPPMHGSYMGPQSNHAMSNHSYPPATYGPGHQMHPQAHGGQYMPMMMPPPSQYPNKPSMSHVPTPTHPPAGVNSAAPPPPPPPHVSQMMPSDRSTMAYYASRMPGPPHHGPPPSPHQQPPYYMRHQMPQQPNKMYYPNSGTSGVPYPGHAPGGMPSMMMPGQHPGPHMIPPHQQHPPGPMAPMHHHAGHAPPMSMQVQQPPHVAAYGNHGLHHNAESSVSTSTTSSVTHTTATAGTTNHSNGNIRHPQPPSIMDEVSQTSTASSQAADDSCASSDMPSSHKPPNAKHHLSHPSTPNTSNLGSPGAASLSSFHDDFDSVSSPSWPRTPASPALNSSQFDTHSHSTKRPDSVQKLYEMTDDPDRKTFLDKFLQFQEDRGTPLNQVPTISKIPLDLYRLYISVKERGGFVEVTRSKMWKECAQFCSIANSSSAAYTLRKQYMKHLLPFECKFDRGGIDPGPVLSSLESSTASNRKKANSAKLSGSGQSTPTTPRLSPNDNSSSSYHNAPPSGPPHPGYEIEQHGNYPSSTQSAQNVSGQHPGHVYPHPHPQAQYHHSEYPYPPHGAATPGQMPPPPAPSQHANQNNVNNSQPQNSTTPSTNHESISVKDPFADDDQSSSTSTTTSANFPPRPHYTVPPNNTNSYYNQMPPNSQSQHHPPTNNYPESHQASSHYPDGQFPRSSAPVPPNTSDAQPTNVHPQYGHYSRSGMNGPSHGYYGPYPHPPSSQQAAQSQQMPYDQQAPPPPPPPPAHPPPGQLQPRGPYEHHPRPMTTSHEHFPQTHNNSHRYPVPNNAHHPPTTNGSGNYGPVRAPYGPHHSATPGMPPHHHPTSQPQNSQVPPPPPPENFGKNSEPYNSSMKSPLAQRLLAAKVSQSSTQAYTGSQFSTTVSSNSSGAPIAQSSPAKPSSTVHNSNPQQANSNISWMSPSNPRYTQPKRHPDFAKQGSESYASHSYPQAPYNHYSSASPGPRPSSGQWNRDSGQYRMSAPYMQGHPPYPNVSSSANREPWPESRATPTSNSESSAPHWPPNRYPGYPPDFPHYSHSASHGMGSKLVPSQMQNYNARHEMAGPRPGYLSQMMNSHNSHSSSKISMIMNTSHASSHSTHGPYAYSNSSSYPFSSSTHSSMRRDITFPPNSVEATVPTMSKKRKLTARDISPVEAWRLYMALKSGLLAESSFALDVLNIYSNDDSTLIFFGLTNMPGMLEVLLEHYKCYLNEMFDNLFDDTEIGYEAKQLRIGIEEKYSKYKNGKLNVKSKPIRQWYELEKDFEENNENKDKDCDDDNNGEEYVADKQAKNNSISSDQVVLLNTTNYTHVTRTGKPVKFKKTKNLFITDYNKNWDQIKNGFASGNEHWANGGGETTSHIQTHLEPKENYLRFVRLIKEHKVINGNYSMVNGNSHDLEDVLSCDDSIDEDKKLSDKSEDEEKRKKKRDEFLNNEEQYPKIRLSDRERYWKKLNQPEYEEESYDQDEPTVCTGRDYQDSIKSRCVTVSNLLRNLTFVPGNDLEMCKHPGLLLVLSRLILLHHVHAIKRKRKISEIDCSTLSANKLDDETLFNLTNDEKDKSSDDDKLTEKEWWWDSLHIIRENTLVTIANLSGHLDLSSFPEEISLTIFDGLLHWAVCPSSYAQDSLPSAHSSLSPRRLAYETLSKLSIIDSNVDLILATPPWSRIEKLFSNLARSLGRHEEQTVREFSIVLLSNFSSAEASSARAIALTGCAIPLLIGFIEQVEQSALHVANTQGIQALRENPELMGTTLDMVRRTAATLRNLARVSENRTLFIQYEQRLLSLVMSQILDQSVAGIIADVLYECSYVTLNNQTSNTITA